MCALFTDHDDEELFESDAEAAFPAKLWALKQLVNVFLVMTD